MSCYEWEQGSIKIPAKEYGRIKKEMIAAIQKYSEDNYNNAIKLYDIMIAAAKGKRGVDWVLLYQKNKCVKNDNPWNFHDPIDLDPEFKFPYRYGTENKRPPKPKKKDYKIKIDRKRIDLQFGDANILFLDKGHIVDWHVSENNHAADTAREHFFAKVLFTLLDAITWTKGSGGTIVGNNEYNRESEGVGGGGNFLVREYGMKKEMSVF